VGDAGILDGPLESTVPYFLARNTISMIDSFRSREKPFFIWHNFWGPHTPYFVPREFIEMYRDVEIPPWPNFEWESRNIPGPHLANIHPRSEELSWKDWAATLRYYYAFSTLIDSQIGRVMDHLRETGVLESTVVLFTSDHGETLGSHGGMTDKGWHHWEETHRIPFVIRRPGDVPGRRMQELVSLADVYPTILDLAGVTPGSEPVHGRSLLPLTEGRAKSWRDMVVTEFHGVMNQGMTQRTLRWGKIKYGYNCCCEDELYDLEKDPHEMDNRIHDPAYDGILLECRKRLAAWMEQTGDRVEQMYREKVSARHPELAGGREPWLNLSGRP